MNIYIIQVRLLCDLQDEILRLIGTRSSTQRVFGLAPVLFRCVADSANPIRKVVCRKGEMR